MTNSDFDEFVKRQQSEQQKEATFNPKQQLEQWLGYLDALYNQSRDYLQNYIESGTAQIEYRDKILNEDFAGSYVVKEMILKIGRATVVFTPIGTVIVGAKGRVDVQGPAGTARLVLINKLATTARSLIRVTVRSANDPPPPPPSTEATTEIDWVWKIASPPPEMKFIDLTQEAFFNMILSVANA